MVVRDHQSHEIASRVLEREVLLTPDMAFMLGALERPQQAERPVFALARDDHEAMADGLAPVAARAGLEPTDWGRPKPPARTPEGFVIRLDAGLARLPRPFRDLGVLERRLGWSYEWMAQHQLERALQFLSRGRVVVTDRLHAHILSEMLGIPHVAADSGYGKIRAYHETWMGSSTIAHVESSAEAAVAKALELAAR